MMPAMEASNVEWAIRGVGGCEGWYPSSCWPFGIPPKSEDVKMMLEPGEMPELRRVELSAIAFPLKRSWIRCNGMDVLEKISCLSTAKVESGGRFTVIVCPSSIFTRT